MTRITIDSNLWEQIVHPNVFPKPPSKHAQLLAVHNALKIGQFTGFICESVVTLEGLKKSDRPTFMTTQTMRPRTIETGDPESKITVFAPDQSARPNLMPVLTDRLKDAVALGIRVIELPYYKELSLPPGFLMEMSDAFVDRFGPIAHAIEQRGVGRAVLMKLGRELAQRDGGSHTYFVGALPQVKNLTNQDGNRIKLAVAEAADGDAVAAHIAVGNDYFVSHDRGKGAKISILDEGNRAWLTSAFGVKFLTLSELSALI